MIPTKTESFARSLELALAGPLPGELAQRAMAPGYLAGLGGPEQPGSARREASVLVLLYFSGGEPRFPLIRRVESGGPHGGQISLPGGGREPGESPGEAALRETEEELGADPSSIRLLGALSELWLPSSRFQVSPFVGFRAERPAFRPSPAEVAGILEPGLSELLDPSRRRSGLREIGGRRWELPYYLLAGGEVWGATARILAELEALLRAAGLG